MERKSKAKLYSIITLAVTVGVIFVFASPIHGLNAARMAGNWSGAFVFAYLLTMLFTRKPERRHFRSPIALSIALVVVFQMNVKDFLMARQSKSALEVLSTVSGPQDFKKKLKANQDNPVLKIAAFVAEAAKNSVQEIIYLAANLQPPELDAPIAFEKASVEDMRKYHRALKFAEGTAHRAAIQVDFIFQRERSIAADHLKKFNMTKVFEREFYKGVDRRHKDYTGFYKRFFRLKAEQFALNYQLVATLISEAGRFKRNKFSGNFVFQNRAVVDGFNELFKRIQSTEKAISEHMELGDAIDRRYQKEFENLIKLKD